MGACIPALTILDQTINISFRHNTAPPHLAAPSPRSARRKAQGGDRVGPPARKGVVHASRREKEGAGKHPTRLGRYCAFNVAEMQGRKGVCGGSPWARLGEGEVL